MKIIDDNGNISIVIMDILVLTLFPLHLTWPKLTSISNTSCNWLLLCWFPTWIVHGHICMDPHHQNSFSYVREVETKFPSIPHASSKLSRGAWMKVMIRSDERGETVVKLNQAVCLCLTNYSRVLSWWICPIFCHVASSVPFCHTDLQWPYPSNKRLLF